MKPLELLTQETGIEGLERFPLIFEVEMSDRKFMYLEEDYRVRGFFKGYLLYLHFLRWKIVEPPLYEERLIGHSVSHEPLTEDIQSQIIDHFCELISQSKKEQYQVSVGNSYCRSNVPEDYFKPLLNPNQSCIWVILNIPCRDLNEAKKYIKPFKMAVESLSLE